MTKWYARPVLFVSDIAASVEFYTGKLGFVQRWRHEEDGRPLVAQVDREGCELILSCQWREKNGRGMIFISLDQDGFRTLPAECANTGVDVTKGFWGYPVLIVDDPDGNQLYFPDPGE
jgi:catechol 2,3-dioxygenase-like lactoylglutathione lyase family enzyme